MKPLFLSIEGLKSVSDRQTINFEKLSENGVFGIFGRTGSGKSTILDAIILALYGDVVNGKPIKEAVNTGCMQTHVSLIFSVSKNGRTVKYGVERLYKFNKARTDVTLNYAKLWRIGDDGTEYSEADNSREISEKILGEIIGLKKEDFLKCIALPQGEFSAFVKLTRGERLKVIGKLFDLEKYGMGLYDKIKNKLSGLANEAAELKGSYEMLEEYRPEKMSELKIAVDVARAKVETTKKKKIVLQEKAEGAKKYISLCKDKRELDALILKKSADRSVIEGFKADIELYDRIYKEHGRIKEVVKAEEEIAALSFSIERRCEKIKQLEENKTKLSEKLSRIPEKEDDIARLKARCEKINEVKDKEEDLLRKKEKLSSLRKLYSSAKTASEENLKAAGMHERNGVKLREQAAGIDDESLLVKIGNAAASETLSRFSKDMVAFLGRLKKLIGESAPFDNVNAVNRLIDEEIEYISAVCGQEAGADELSKVLGEAAKLVKEKNRLIALAAEEDRLALEFRKESEKAQKDLDRVVEEGGALGEECKTLEKEITAITGGKSTPEALELENEKIKALNDEINLVRSENSAVSEELAALRAATENDVKRKENLTRSAEMTRAEYAPMLKELGIDEKRACEVLQKSTEIDEKRQKVRKFDEDFSFATKKMNETESKLAELSEYSGGESILAEYKTAEEEFSDDDKYYNKIYTDYENGLKKSEKWCIIAKKREENEASVRLYQRLADLVRAGKFMEFIADEYLTEVATDAEKRVLELTSGKYGLLYDGEFFVTDNMRGGVRRPVSGLSGGETFLVSLSLALALASEISRKALIPAEFFFLDEGFGTLDDELIEAVTQSLEKLRKEDLTVGLITHVTELKNRIQSSLTVTGADLEHGTRFNIG